MKTKTSVQGLNEFSVFTASFEVSPIQKSCLSTFQDFFWVLGEFKGFTQQTVTLSPGKLLIFVLWKSFDFYLADIFLQYRRRIFKVEITLTWDFSHPQLLFGTKYSAVKGLRKSHDEILIHGLQWIWQCPAPPVLRSHSAAL